MTRHMALLGTLVASAALVLSSCPLPADNGLASLLFEDGATGLPVAGVEVTVDGAPRVTGGDGRIAIDLGGPVAQVTAHLDPQALQDLGYTVYDGPQTMIDDYGFPDYFRVTLVAGFEKTILLSGPPAPSLVSVSGVAWQKGTTNPIPEVNSGELNVYTLDGYAVAYDDLGAGATFSVNVPAGTLVFMVTEYTTNYTYYWVTREVTGPESGVTLSYDEPDADLSGTAADAEIVEFSLRLGDFHLRIHDGPLMPVAGSFDFSLPLPAGSALRLTAGKEVATGGFRLAWSLGATDITGATSDLAVSFADGSAFPDPWVHDLAFDFPSRTISWNPAGNATGYHVVLDDRVWHAVVEGTGLTLPAGVVPSQSISVQPFWANGTLPSFGGEAATTIVQLPPAVLGGGEGEPE